MTTDGKSEIAGGIGKAEDLSTPPGDLAHPIGEALLRMASMFAAEYDEMTAEDLEARWFFKFDPQRSPVSNLYRFYDALTLYGRSCRRWEERHNGSCCVVERVRDTYLVPKIRAFAAEFRDASGPVDENRRLREVIAAARADMVAIGGPDAKMAIDRMDGRLSEAEVNL